MECDMENYHRRTTELMGGSGIGGFGAEMFGEERRVVNESNRGSDRRFTSRVPAEAVESPYDGGSESEESDRPDGTRGNPRRNPAYLRRRQARQASHYGNPRVSPPLTPGGTQRLCTPPPNREDITCETPHRPREGFCTRVPYYYPEMDWAEHPEGDEVNSFTPYRELESAQEWNFRDRIWHIRLLKDWSIKFSGEDRDEAEIFLCKLCDFQRLYRLPDRELLEILISVLDKTAASWYRTNSRDFRSWEEFRVAFQRRFVGIMDDEDLLEEMRRRTQGKGERTETFLEKFRLIVDRFQRPPTLAQQLRIIYRNLDPEIRNFIMDRPIYSYSDVQWYGEKFEKMRELDRRYVPPPTRDKTRIPAAACNVGNRPAKVSAVQESKVTERPLETEEVETSQSESGSVGTVRSRNRRRRGKRGKRNREQDEVFVAEVAAFGTVSGPVRSPKSVPAQAEPTPPAQCQPATLPPRAMSSNAANAVLGRGSVGTCFHCHRTEHRARECPNRPCFACQQTGHYADQCPNRPRRELFCFWCYAPGVTVASCRECGPVYAAHRTAVALSLGSADDQGSHVPPNPPS